jgi:hypothetical protein
MADSLIYVVHDSLPHLTHDCKFRQLLEDSRGHGGPMRDSRQIAGNTYEIDPRKTITENVQCHSDACGGAFRDVSFCLKLYR